MKRKRVSDSKDRFIERRNKIRKLVSNNPLKRPEKRIPEDSKYILEDIRRAKRRKYNYGETLLNDFGTQMGEYKRMKQSRYEDSKSSIHDIRERISALNQYREVNNILRMCHNERKFRKVTNPSNRYADMFDEEVEEEETEDTQFFQKDNEDYDVLDCQTDITIRSYEEDVQAMMEDLEDDDFQW